MLRQLLLICIFSIITNFSISKPIKKIRINGRRQSPIDIKTNKVRRMHASPLGYVSVDFSTNDANSQRQSQASKKNLGFVKLKNKGHGVGFSSDSWSHLRLLGAGLNRVYKPVEFHFHWGMDKVHGGSEHRVDGVKWPVELHMVHIANKFVDVKEALLSGEADALAVIGVFIDVVEEKGGVDESTAGSGDHDYIIEDDEEFENRYDHQHPQQQSTSYPLEPLVDAFSHIVDSEKEVIVDLRDVSIDDLLPEDRRSFWRYDGSLTTPDFDEIVVWTVMQQPLELPEAFMAELAKVRDSKGQKMRGNARVVQPLKLRTVWENVL